MSRLLRPVAVSAIAGALLIGCGDGDNSAANAVSAATTTVAKSAEANAATTTVGGSGPASTSKPSGADAAGASGSLTIGGASSKIDRIVRCKLTDDKELDLVVLAGKSQIFIFVNRFAGSATIQSIDYQGPEGLFSGSYSQQQGAWIGADLSDRITAAPIVVDGNRVSAKMKLVEEDTDKTLDVVLNLNLPAASTDCN